MAKRPTTTTAATETRTPKTDADKRAAFLKVGNRRVQAALKQIRLLRNLSNRSQYHYTEDDVLKMLAALNEGVDQLGARFTGESTQETGFSF